MGVHVRVVVRVLRKRQVTIPKEVADLLDIREGDYLVMRVEDGRLVVEKVDPLDMLRGFLAERSGKGLAEEIDRERRLSEREL
ncbi:transcriptional regulator, AbrB family [Pyrolobus fumarii 1A]|uniref:Transcriptional regulator, AbrB family n=1 Tax=Pyrolobus fumarii (strain DSM 11204 / 1A) TaxID=694429 RepID=G0EFI0_PYRF1|nr:transcriptional regulator, AbrB family [Pyrolobus fumarii 1A]